MKKMILGALALALVPASANAAGFINGGFEQGPANVDPWITLGNGSTALTGWVVTGDSIDLKGNYWQAREGNRSIDLNGNGPGGIMQTFDTIVGTTYNVKFSLAGNPDARNQKVVSSVASGSLPNVYTFDLPNSHQNMMWQDLSYSFTAASTTTTLSFTSGNDSAQGPALDAVSVTAVPEPATWAMMLIGFGGIGASMRRRAGSRRVAIA
ncbi:choice-of-anchor C family protein [Sphingomonas floccifaciens]|uniref:Choice-of-anchor C family protein n=1 Tax=Sphingomonas floccifaciens TaxID=1844115 RepID=A0ABW4NA11_9SPHN